MALQVRMEQTDLDYDGSMSAIFHFLAGANAHWPAITQSAARPHTSTTAASAAATSTAAAPAAQLPSVAELRQLSIAGGASGDGGGRGLGLLGRLRAWLGVGETAVPAAPIPFPPSVSYLLAIHASFSTTRP